MDDRGHLQRRLYDRQPRSSWAPLYAFDAAATVTRGKERRWRAVSRIWIIDCRLQMNHSYDTTQAGGQGAASHQMSILPLKPGTCQAFFPSFVLERHPLSRSSAELSHSPADSRSPRSVSIDTDSHPSASLSYARAIDSHHHAIDHRQSGGLDLQHRRRCDHGDGECDGPLGS